MAEPSKCECDCEKCIELNNENCCSTEECDYFESYTKKCKWCEEWADYNYKKNRAYIVEPSKCECDCAKCKELNNEDCCINEECDRINTCKWCEEWEKHGDEYAKADIAELYARCDKYIERMKTDKYLHHPQDLVRYTEQNEISKERYYDAMCKYIHKHKFYSLVDSSIYKGYDYNEFYRHFKSIEWYEFMKKFNPTIKYTMPLSYKYYMNKIKYFSKKGKCTKCYNVRDLIPLDCAKDWHCYQCYKIVDGSCWSCRHNTECEYDANQFARERTERKIIKYTLI